VLVYGSAAVLVVIGTTFKHGQDELLLAVFGLETFVLTAAAVWLAELAFVPMAGLVMLVGAGGYVASAGDQFATKSSAWPNLIVGLSFCMAAERLVRWRIGNEMF